MGLPRFGLDASLYRAKAFNGSQLSRRISHHSLKRGTELFSLFNFAYFTTTTTTPFPTQIKNTFPLSQLKLHHQYEAFPKAHLGGERSSLYTAPTL